MLIWIAGCASCVLEQPIFEIGFSVLGAPRRLQMGLHLRRFRRRFRQRFRHLECRITLSCPSAPPYPPLPCNCERAAQQFGNAWRRRSRNKMTALNSDNGREKR